MFDKKGTQYIHWTSWCKDPGRIGKRCKHCLKQCHIHKAIWPWPNIKGQICTRLWWGEHVCSVGKGCIQLFRHYHIHNAVWSWPGFKSQKCHIKVNINVVCDFDTGNIPTELRGDAGIPWHVIGVFTRCSDTHGSTSPDFWGFSLTTLLGSCDKRNVPFLQWD